MTDKLTKLYMTGVAGIYLMFLIGGFSLIGTFFCVYFDVVAFIMPISFTGLFISSILFYVYLTLLKHRMYDIVHYDKSIISGDIRVEDVTDEFDRDLSELDDDNNYA